MEQPTVVTIDSCRWSFSTGGLQNTVTAINHIIHYIHTEL